ncbi:hypothetical protein SAMN04488075_0328 [Paracoccus alkenifer]|uniref:Uncharacterized protein n=1 Tax=Paracoccus alkenifer TaxID=65735 RepID=A0A1H6JIR8_9RHOB|nr:hypothetical protein SAMN04488075_0328 [Paracoccus alkenifer]
MQWLVRHNLPLYTKPCRSRKAIPQDVFCSTKPSWQGGYCVPPLHPPSRGSVRGLTPCQNQKTVSPVNHSQGLENSLSTCTEPWIMRLSRPLNPTRKETSLSLHPSTWRAFLPPRPQTMPWRPRTRAHRRYPSLEPSPPTKGRATPLGAPTNRPPVGYRQRIGAEPDQGAATPIEAPLLCLANTPPICCYHDGAVTGGQVIRGRSPRATSCALLCYRYFVLTCRVALEGNIRE